MKVPELSIVGIVSFYEKDQHVKPKSRLEGNQENLGTDYKLTEYIKVLQYYRF